MILYSSLRRYLRQFVWVNHGVLIHSNVRKDSPLMIPLRFRLKRGSRGREFGEVKEGSPPLCGGAGGGCRVSKGSQHFSDAVVCYTRIEFAKHTYRFPISGICCLMHDLYIGTKALAIPSQKQDENRGWVVHNSPATDFQWCGHSYPTASSHIDVSRSW